MLYVMLVISILMVIGGVLLEIDEFAFIGIVSNIAIVIGIFSVLASYNSTKTTAVEKIKVLEERNKEVLSQIEPVVNKYLEYESSTLKSLKLNTTTVVALSMYPELKGNTMLQEQLNIIKANQREITELKLDVAGLKSYKMWIFMD